MTLVIVIEGVVIVLLLVLMAGLLKSHAEILRQLDRLSKGEPQSVDQPLGTGLGTAPSMDIKGVDPKGSSVTVTLRHDSRETLIAFLSTGCASCRVFWADLNRGDAFPSPTTRPLIVTKGSGHESPGKVAELAPRGVNLVMSDEAWDAFRVPLTPYFVLVGGDGTIIGEGSASNLDHLTDLFAQAANDAQPLKLGTKDRGKMIDQSLRSSGVEPGDSTLYQDPLSP